MGGERWAVVLAGGVGSRFWPLSTPERPKQLLPLVNDKSMLVNTIERLEPLVNVERMLISTNAMLADATAQAVPKVPADNVIAEPRPAGTAAALAWAASEIQRRAGPDAVMMCVHADWAVADPESFRDTLKRAGDLAESTRGLVTVGIVPTRPDPGFGYIQPGESLEISTPDSDSAKTTMGQKVIRFVEKPHRDLAAEMVQHGYLWNSGIFVWRVADFLNAIQTLTPEVAPALEQFAGARPDRDRFFADVKSVSVDVGVLERSDRVYVLPGNFGWDDVGTWAAIHRIRTPDASANVVTDAEHGYTVETTNSLVYTDDQSTVVLYGVSDLVVVSIDGLTVVTTLDKSADLKTLVESLPPHLRTPS